LEWAVTFWKLGRDVIRIATELEYVPLREAHVFEHLPGRVGQPFNLTIAEICGKTVDEVVK
jgi:hypothetical protein